MSLSIAPWTSLVMIPTNFKLIEMNEDKGGKRSEKSAREGKKGGGSAECSVDGVGEVSQFTDLSGPQEKTDQESTAAENQKVKALLEKFGILNAMRAGLIGAGGVVGLVTALA